MNFIPLRYRKAESVFCGGARGTRTLTSHRIVTSRKTKEFLKSPRFLRSEWYKILKFQTPTLFDYSSRIFICS